MMNPLETFLHWLWMASLSGLFLALLVIALSKVLSKRLSAGWIYGLWLLVLFKLLVPYTPETAFIPKMHGLFSFAAAGVGAKDSGQPPSLISERLPLNSPVFYGSSPPKDESSANTWPWLQVIFCLWVAGGLLVLGRAVWIYRGLHGHIRKLAPLIDPQVLTLLDNCKREQKAFLPLDIIPTDAVESPALIGFLRPRLLLPKHMVAHLTQADFRHIFMHELAHFRRLDILGNWFISLALAVHWFNPFLWWALGKMRTQQEIACDHRVVGRLDRNGARAYGQTVIKILELSGAYKSLPGMVGLLEDRAHLKQRIRQITNPLPMGLFRHLWGMLGAGLLVFTGLITGTSHREDPETLLLRLQSAYQSGKLETVLSMYHPDAQFFEVDSDGVILSQYGVDGIRSWYSMAILYTPKLEILEKNVEENEIVFKAMMQTGKFEVVGLFESEGKGRLVFSEGKVVEHYWTEESKHKQRRLALFDRFIEWVKRERPHQFKTVFGSDLFVRHRATGPAVNQLFFEWVEVQIAETKKDMPSP